MLRLGLGSSTRPLFSGFARPATRQFSSLRPQSRILDAVKQRTAAIKKNGLFSRSYMQEPNVIRQQASTPSWQRTALTLGGLAGTAVVVNGFLNRETRDGYTAGEQALLHETFKYTAGGLVLTALAARQMFRSGVAFRLMTANPWVVLGVGLVGGIGTMMGTIYTSPDKPIQKHLFWLAFNACQAVTLSPLYFFAPAILGRAALYTCMSVGALSYVGATAKSDQYLYLGGPLLAGLFVVAGASLAPMILPMGMRSLAISESISLYGGLAVFSGFVLYDVQKILQHARIAEQRGVRGDAIAESLSLELDMINIFIRIVQILAMQGGGNRK
ncbi:Bax inhibitor family protein [Cylindrobasidium torrendii FP15055 ss-10]|uniref:Bax inhibitor family protein n=1 Tax=Cylindrobasidium torrendii FP15055 ss-10 TaxID=1314674 RepID=A0A0D7BV73_9AGAR|nr:Bax inhibitor family protein [Cylindrobasidium torrendii FP15055 ss-10]